ncbi:aminoglycoside phosphotransferase family protein [Paenibacillus sp. ACRSA]|uniref:aminoglycoside phosphotransferase family protein n=1 Tax=Paenibacillus sp. ACRSA TaxID=2918211 RepID=UPI001EF612D7|nr:aminoglycoside phosphotransferase family protein [Paenibacillus sp. ACRSA]MCG7376756.1 aminoglycoside phosphotransferase family protein [Paenibacillus sp. ACRSA]
MTDHEEVLAGGNVNEVIKIGGTVRRNSQNAYVNALLVHLEKVGLSSVPRYLGMDEQGREILSYLQGTVPGNQYPEIERYMWSDEVLIQIAKLLRSYHDATVGFTTSLKSQNDYPDPSQHEVVCHNDAAPYNMVFQDKIPVGIIDFDMAGKGPRIWDIVYTLYTSVPLSGFSPGEADRTVFPYNSAKHAFMRKNRIKLFFDTYGIDIPTDLKQWVIQRIRKMCSTLTERAASGDAAFSKLIEEGHLAHYEEERRFLEKHFDDWS